LITLEKVQNLFDYLFFNAKTAWALPIGHIYPVTEVD